MDGERDIYREGGKEREGIWYCKGREGSGGMEEMREGGRDRKGGSEGGREGRKMRGRGWVGGRGEREGGWVGGVKDGGR